VPSRAELGPYILYYIYLGRERRGASMIVTETILFFFLLKHPAMEPYLSLPSSILAVLP
jgi:hypothetical protein